MQHQPTPSTTIVVSFPVGFFSDATPLSALFAWLISHQPAVLFSHNNQTAVLFSQNK
jgi:hypothetical protein